MRIAMISAHSSPLATPGGKEAGGMNVYIRELSRELGRRGNQVDIFTRTQDPDAPLLVSPGRNVRVVHMRAGPPAPYDKNWLLDHLPEFVNHVRCFADGEDISYDVIHSHYWLSGEAAIALRRAWGVPMVHMFHTLGALKNRVARSAEERETQQRVAIERHVAAEADVLVAATPLDRADLVWHCGAEPQRIEVIPCGVDVQRFAVRDMAAARAALDLPPLPHRIVLLVGRIEPLKGIDALIEAVALLRQRHPEWSERLVALVVGGANEGERSRWNAEQQRLHALRVKLGVEQNVCFLGAQSQERLPQFYAASDIVTMPSHYESFGMAALEGLACGRPVVATNAGGPAYIVEDGVSGLLTPPNNPSALADQVERLLANDALRTNMGRAARDHAARFSWPMIADQIAQVYCQLVGQQKCRAAG
ncbi:MAG TPA: glycosyltransferase [Roseiflexaceae bacterium]|nr:glycosyltransferase [Roseiflexaceae bacterium]